jgi:hypothetical protein
MNTNSAQRAHVLRLLLMGLPAFIYNWHGIPIVTGPEGDSLVGKRLAFIIKPKSK